jgi:hypothetical protein
LRLPGESSLQEAGLGQVVLQQPDATHRELGQPDRPVDEAGGEAKVVLVQRLADPAQLVVHGTPRVLADQVHDLEEAVVGVEQILVGDERSQRGRDAGFGLVIAAAVVVEPQQAVGLVRVEHSPGLADPPGVDALSH